MTTTIPDVVLGGAMRAGTTTLAALLDDVPGLAVSAPKEPNHWSWGQPADDDVYAAHWSGRRGLRIDASTSMTRAAWSEQSALRLTTAAPEVRFLFLMRDPWLRTVSHWRFHALRYGERRPLEVALRETPDYLGTSRYGTVLRPWLDRLPANQVLLLTTDELAADPERVVRRITDHLGLAPADHVETVRANAEDQLARWPDSVQRLRNQHEGARRLWAAAPDRLRQIVRGALGRASIEVPDHVVETAQRHEWEAELRSDARDLVSLLASPVPTWLASSQDDA